MIMPSSSLIPDDPSVLLTTAGMQQFKKYYIEPSLSLAKNVVSVQKCFRTSDIDEVGDDSHLTFFEMLGNFSFGGYFKKEAIEHALKFLEEEMKINHDRLSATFFEGDNQIESDKISHNELKKYFEESKIIAHGRQDNFWGPTGSEGPCGPTVEIYVDGVEIWNLVFNEYYCKPDGSLEKLKTPGVDTGMGLERLAMVVQNKKNIFETDLLSPLTETAGEFPIGTQRILADHARAISFLIADGVRPSNKEAGYILRRLMRRIVVHGKNLENLLSKVVEMYGHLYPELKENIILSEFQKENEKFQKTLELGLRELNKLQFIDSVTAFKLFETYGLPYEVVKELGGEMAKGLSREDFDMEFKKHQEISRAGAEKKFGGHGLLLNTGELKAKNEEELKIVTRLHTATHLLQAALRRVLGDEVKQAGSDITAERTRFDFSFVRKPTEDELREVERLVNEAISKNLPVNFEEIPIEEAKKTGALFFFKEKYPNRVRVYTIGPNSSTSSEPPFSREFCGGPHVKNTGEIGHFKIQKCESIGSSTRRIRAVVE